ncbi:MAG: VanZ family protein [Candidatus Hydrogenedentota bacterium]
MALRYYMLVAVYCAALFMLSASPNPAPGISRFPGADKAGHAVLYGGLAAAVGIGMRRSQRAYSPRTLFYVPVIFAAAYGVSDEVHQWFVPGRTLDVWDVLADAAGAVLVQYALCRWWAVLPPEQGTAPPPQGY